ncbi:MAG: hypothetical protein K5879_08985 [Lachnospiraceae bacterium]|nr:hypothetical protein [Lachnospiraceae bacterium]
MSRKKKSKLNMTDLSDDVLFESDTDDDADYEEDDEDAADDMPNPEDMDFEKVKSSYFGISDWTGGLPDTVKVNDIIRAKNQKKERERILGIVHFVLYMIFFSGITLCMAEYGNSRTTDFEFFYSRFAMIFFLGVLWTLERVRLINLTSLFVSLAYVPYAVFYPMMAGKTSANMMIIVVELITRWMVLMLLTDIAVTKKVRPDRRFNSPAFALLCITSVFTLMNGNGGFAPIAFLYFLIMCFIPVSAKEWEKLTDCILYSGMFTFVVVTVFSFTGNPMVIIPRDYYMFTDDIGQFYALCLALASFALIRFSKKYGRLSFPYFISIVWLIATVVMALNKGTTGIIPGVLLMFFVIFLFGPKMGRLPFSLVRPAIVLLIIAAIIAGNIVFANMIAAEDFDTVAFAENVMKSPLSLFANVAEDLTGKVEMFHRGAGGYGDFIQPKTFAAYLNVFMDSRIGIFFETIGALNWDGHVLVGVNADSFVMATKNEYIQLLYEFGYFGGGLNILFYVGLWIVSIVKFVKERKERMLLPLLLGGMTLGVWMNVSSGIFYPLVFFFALSLYPILVDLNPEKKQKKTKKKSSQKTGKSKKSAEELAEETAEDTEKKAAEAADAAGNNAEAADMKDAGQQMKTKPAAEAENFAGEQPEEPAVEKPAEEQPTQEKPRTGVTMLPEEKADHRKKGLQEVEGRPLDRSQLEDEEIISIRPIK